MTPKELDAQARKVLGLPPNPDDTNIVDRFLHFVFQSPESNAPTEGDVQRLHDLRKAGLTNAQIQQIAPDLLKHATATSPKGHEQPMSDEHPATSHPSAHLEPMAHKEARHYSDEPIMAMHTPEPTIAQLEQAPLQYTIEHIAKETPGLGPKGAPLLAAILLTESGGNQNATSPVGAIGYMQLMPGTAKALGVNPYDPVQNIKGGAIYIANLLKKFHSIPLAIAAYNAGPEAVVSRAWLKYPETTQYVAKVLQAYAHITGTR